MYIKAPPEAYYGKLGNYKPEPPGEQEYGKLFFRFPQALKINGCAGKKYKQRCAEMGDPSGEEQYRRCGFHIGCIAAHAINVKKIPGMVKRHKDHYYSAQYID